MFKLCSESIFSVSPSFKSIFILIVLSFFNVNLLAQSNIDLNQRAEKGSYYISFSAEPNGNPASSRHAGYDIFDGNKKLFYVGSGWQNNDKGKWGLWVSDTNKSVFTLPVQANKTNTLLIKIDFATDKTGDEKIDLWLNPTNVETSKPDISLKDLSLSGITKVVAYWNAQYKLLSIRSGKNLNDILPKPNETKSESNISKLFTEKIHPLFVNKCGGCHGDAGKKIKGDYDMRSRDLLIKGGESGVPAVNLKNPLNSPLLKSVMRVDEDTEMPPKENDKLTKEEIGWIREWIQGGAPWPKTSQKVVYDKNWSKADEKGHVRVKTSGGENITWTNRRYDPKGLWAYQPIKKTAVPSKFKNSQAPKNPIDAFILKELENSGLSFAPKAEQSTLVRRASFGLTGLPSIDSALGVSGSSFEDTIDKLLQSPHYGEKMAQQWLDVTRYADSNGFAKDEFRPDAHKYRSYVINSFNNDKAYNDFVREQIAGDEMKISGQEAVSFLWMGPWEQTAMSVAAVTRQQWLDDVTNSIGVTFLGNQLMCAKCHDHKFDPIPTRDYYSIQAIFANVKHSKNGGNFAIQPTRGQKISILKGGALESPGEVVSPGALSVLETTTGHQFNKSLKPRTALAEWIASPKNPLTARVMVNRVWQMHFGIGLVATPNDFGKMGSKPSHPELLDWLSQWFMDNKWSVKKLHRLIMTSSTYQQSSIPANESKTKQSDPDNKLLSYFPMRRLTAEEIRDSMLSASGELNRKIGGPSVFIEINWEVAFQPRLVMGKLKPPYQPDPIKENRYRRSIYAVKIRNLGHPLLEVFNLPNLDLTCGRRDETTVTPQVFTLLHGEQAHERALALADKASKKSKTLSDQIGEIFKKVYGRSVSSKEMKLLEAHALKQEALHKSHKLNPETLPLSVKLADVKEGSGKEGFVTFKLDKMKNYQNDLKPWEVNERTRALADLVLVLFNSSEFLYVY